VSDAATSPNEAPVARPFKRLLAALGVIAVLTLVSTGNWPSGIGVLLGWASFQWLISRALRHVRSPLSETSRPPGVFISAGMQGTVGLVIVFVGILIRGSVVLFFTAIVGTWMIAAALFMTAISMATGRTRD
jgi:hypothetical protein